MSATPRVTVAWRPFLVYGVIWLLKVISPQKHVNFRMSRERSIFCLFMEPERKYQYQVPKFKFQPHSSCRIFKNLFQWLTLDLRSKTGMICKVYCLSKLFEHFSSFSCLRCRKGTVICSRVTQSHLQADVNDTCDVMPTDTLTRKYVTEAVNNWNNWTRMM